MSTRQNTSVTANLSFAGVVSLQEILFFLILRQTRLVTKWRSAENSKGELPEGEL
jgi:hypothetical protein